MHSCCALSRETIGNFFSSLPVPNIHSPFYLAHNVEMEEVKSVCPLESIVTAAITQAIWSKLRRPLWFFYALTSRQQKRERAVHRKSKYYRGLDSEGSPVHRKPIWTNCLSSQTSEPPGPFGYFKMPPCIVCWMIATAGVNKGQVKWEAYLHACLYF